VQAYNGSVTANSATQSVTLPLATPALTASAASLTAVNLSWGAIDQASGYKVYQVNGTQATLLATLGSSTLSYQVTGLTPGSTVSFYVQAYNGSVTANSATQSVTLPNTPADLSGVWTSSVGGLDYITQTGNNLTYLNQAGSNSSGTYVASNQISGYGLTGTIDTGTADYGRIVWSNGRIWLRISLGGEWSVNSSGSTSLGSITESGTGLTFDGPSGTSTGSIVGPTQVTGYGTTGALVNGSTIQFANGQVWTKLDLAPNYFTSAGGKTQLLQNGTITLGFVNSQNQSFSGQFADPTHLVTTTAATGFPIGTTATIGGGKITWSTGEVWSESLTVYGTNPSGATISLTVTPTSAFLVNALGHVSHVNITSPTTLAAIDGASAGLTAMRVSGGIQWSNGMLWNNFDFNALNAVLAANIASSPGSQVLEGTNTSGVAVNMISTPTEMWISNAAGELSHIQITSATTLVITDGANAGTTATITGPGKLQWSNGMVWSFDAAALTAFFTNVPHYPFPS
jgi:hypothetical protein